MAKRIRTEKAESEAVRVRTLKGELPPALSNVETGVDEAERRFQAAGAIEPPYNFGTLTSLFEHSSALAPNVQSYATNIDGFGHKFDPIISLTSSDADEKIEQAMIIQRRSLRATPGVSADVVRQDPIPTPEEVAERRKEIERLMRAEKLTLDFFFENCTESESFVSLRRKLRADYEVIGNAWFEVLRNGLGEIAGFTYIPGHTMRCLPLDRQYTEVPVKQRVSPIDFQTVKRKRRLRKHVQVHEQSVMFFKEFGDPRIVSRKTGRVFDSVAALIVADPKDAPATEVVHLRQHSPTSAYGVPRWIGNILAVMGSRQAEEVNFLYFDNKAIPPMAMIVNDGRLTDSTVKRLEDHINTNIKGRKNFHKILIIEGTAASSRGTVDGGSGKMTIELKPLTDAANKDALFMGYDERNTDKIGASFRLPRLLRGDIRDFNRATADAALEFTEQQVFAPERNEFDFMINRLILLDLGVRFWKFTSLTPSVKDSAKLSSIIRDQSDAGTITPNEARELASDVFNRELPRIDDAWADQPLALTLVERRASSQPLAMADDTYLSDHGDEGDDRETPRITATALAQCITVNEARRAYGCEPWDDDRGSLTVSAYAAKFGGASPTAAEVPSVKRTSTRALVRELLAAHETLEAAELSRAKRAFLTAKRAENFDEEIRGAIPKELVTNDAD